MNVLRCMCNRRFQVLFLGMWVCGSAGDSPASDASARGAFYVPADPAYTIVDSVKDSLERFKMREDRNGVATCGLLYMERSWDTAYLWENAEAALAYFEGALETRTSEPSRSRAYELAGLVILQAVLEPCGIRDMQLAGNTLAQRAYDEVCYYGRDEDPYSMNVTRMDAHGGWIGAPDDLVRFALRVGGSNGVPGLLRAETIKTMLTASAANAGYACGWCVNRVPNYWHTGSLPGTTTIVVRTASGLCWAGFANARADGSGLALDQMMWQMARAVPAWRP
jgi:hypothetical protein